MLNPPATSSVAHVTADGRGREGTRDGEMLSLGQLE